MLAALVSSGVQSIRVCSLLDFCCCFSLLFFIYRYLRWTPTAIPEENSSALLQQPGIKSTRNYDCAVRFTVNCGCWYCVVMVLHSALVRTLLIFFLCGQIFPCSYCLCHQYSRSHVFCFSLQPNRIALKHSPTEKFLLLFFLKLYYTILSNFYSYAVPFFPHVLPPACKFYLLHKSVLSNIAVAVAM